jgi:hypothetical protein
MKFVAKTWTKLHDFGELFPLRYCSAFDDDVLSNSLLFFGGSCIVSCLKGFKFWRNVFFPSSGLQLVQVDAEVIEYDKCMGYTGYPQTVLHKTQFLLHHHFTLRCYRSRRIQTAVCGDVSYTPRDWCGYILYSSKYAEKFKSAWYSLMKRRKDI